MDRVYRYIDQNRERFIDELKALLRIPSVATDRAAVKANAEALQAHMGHVGFESRIMESTGNPMVYGARAGTDGSPRVLLYGHYDVQPAEDVELWHSPPWEPTLRDGRIYARGVGDNKAQHFAHIKAVEALEACGVAAAPLKFVIEGEEETGSESLPGFVRDHRELLAAELCYAADGPRHESNRPTVYLGCRGVLGIEMRIAGAHHDVHSGNRGNVVPNPGWRLVQLLASLRDQDGTVLIEGFEDGIEPPNAEERAILAKLPYDGDKLADQLGVESLRTLDGTAYHEGVQLRPTLNICGLVCGYTGPGPKTIIPASAAVKMDIRLVLGQDPDAMAERLRAHLARHGFDDVELEVQDAMKPARTPATNPFVARITGAMAEAAGVEPIILLALGGSIPQYAFVEALGTPCVWSAYANWDEDNHAPNENMDVELFVQSIKMSANVFHTLGRG